MLLELSMVYLVLNCFFLALTMTLLLKAPPAVEPVGPPAAPVMLESDVMLVFTFVA